MTTNYPITDPAEIAKLPTAHYLCVDGTTATRRYGKTLLRPWSVEGRELFLTDAELADLRGGIAARLVPEMRVEDYRSIKPWDTTCASCRGWGVRTYGTGATWRGGIGGAAMTPGVCDKCWGSGKSNGPWLSHREAEATETQRDRAVELLRAVAPYLGRRTPALYAQVKELLAEQETNDD